METLAIYHDLLHLVPSAYGEDAACALSHSVGDTTLHLLQRAFYEEEATPRRVLFNLLMLPVHRDAVQPFARLVLRCGQDDWVRQVAAGLLDLRDDEARDGLLALLRDAHESTAVRAALADVLAEFPRGVLSQDGVREIERALLTVLAQESLPRLLLLRTLAAFEVWGRMRYVARLHPYLHDEDPTVRTAALYAMQALFRQGGTQEPRETPAILPYKYPA